MSMRSARHRRGERGQTIILVAISIVALIAMAALAIDVVTLYVASSEIKQAADAAALAGAIGIANSGATTLCSGSNAPCAGPDTNFANAQSLAQSMAAANIRAITLVNTVNLVLTVGPSVKANSVSDLIALARAKPGTLNYGTSGIGRSKAMVTAARLERSATANRGAWR